MLDVAFNAYYEGNNHLHETHEERMAFARAAIELECKAHPEWFTLEWSQKAGDVRSSPENYIEWLFEKGPKGCKSALEMVCYRERGPVEVQKQVAIELPNYFLVGYIDCVELDTNTIVDIKAVAGWSEITELSYALRAQVPLYRMLMKDQHGLDMKGRYDLLLCRRTPKLQVVHDPDIEYLQQKLIHDFADHHKRVSGNCFERNVDHCFAFNKPCPFLESCWPKLSAIVNKQEPTVT
jgi:hypothetical protein